MIVSRDLGVTSSTGNVPKIRNDLQQSPIPRNNKTTSYTIAAAFRPCLFFVKMMMMMMMMMNE